MSGRFGLVGLVWLVWFSLVNEDDLKRPLVPSKVSKASLELHLRTILGGVGSGRVRSGGLGPIVIIRLSQFNCNCLLELSLAIFQTQKIILFQRIG